MHIEQSELKIKRRINREVGEEIKEWKDKTL